MTSVSVVIPCYRYGHLLPACVASVFDQPGVDVRVLIIDDASPDDSGQVARSLAAADPRVQARVHEVNRGHIATYNEGLDLADGDYVTLLSADDLLTPGSLTRATGLLDANPRVGFAYGYSVYFDGSQPLPPLRLTRPRSRVWDGEEWIARRCRNGTNIISSPEVVVRTALHRQVGGYRPDLPHSGDLEMWLRLAARGDVGVIAGVDQALYRVHQQSMSRTAYATAVADLEQRHAAFETFFDTSAGHLRHPEPLRLRAASAVARRAWWRASRLCRTPTEEARQTADRLAEFGLRIAPQATRSMEYRAWRWASAPGPSALWTRVPVLATAARGRAESWLYWRARKWTCV